MKLISKFRVLLLAVGLSCGGLCLVQAANPAEAALRQQLGKAILSEASEQEKLLRDLANSGPQLVRQVSNDWTRASIYLYELPDGAKVPLLLEDQQDADGKARATRVDNGEYIKDNSGSELRFASTDLTAVDTDAHLRSVIQQTLDML